MARKKTPDTTASLRLDSVEQIKALAHPLRLKLIEQLAMGPATAKQVAERLGLQPTRLYHHVSRLEKAGLIKLVETRPVRGTTEKYYATVAPRLSVGPELFEGEAGRLAGTVASLGVVDGLLTNTRAEVANYLEQNESGASDDELLFAGAEIEADETTIAELRARIEALLQTVSETPEATGDSPKRRYRLLVGWHPLASDD